MPRRLIFSLLFCLACTPESAPPAPEKERVQLGGAAKGWNVVVLTLDTLRADRLGSYGYAAAATPNLDALAARGLRFGRAATVA
ncbi:MAG TPA: sulfatase-like hydrolase/transferase, partial [Thermoanaerobaculia bacterium]|nr:sulfatase-like hydrolase/transferase [Thermoanaerobaculia bacterium]